MFRYNKGLPITRHNNVHYPLQNVIIDKSWKKSKKGENTKGVKLKIQNKS